MVIDAPTTRTVCGDVIVISAGGEVEGPVGESLHAANARSAATNMDRFTRSPQTTWFYDSELPDAADTR
jgi:hypothetical protein